MDNMEAGDKNHMKKRRSDKTSGLAALVLAAALLLSFGTGCSWIGNNVSNYEHDEEINVPAGTYTTLVIENRAGTIRIQNGSGDRITGLLRKKASGNGANILKEVVGAVTYEAQGTGETLRITEVYKTDDRVDFWTWKDTAHPDVNVGLEYELTVPAGVQVVEVYQAAGNTEFNAYTGTVSVANNAGNITFSRVNLTGDSRIALVSGNLDIRVAGIAAGASLVAELTAGNIALTLPKNENIDLAAGVGAGTISGNFDSLPVTNSSVTHTLGDGGARVSVQVASGNIGIQID